MDKNNQNYLLELTGNGGDLLPDQLDVLLQETRLSLHQFKPSANHLLN
jgi:hypothetical protein